MHMGNAIERSSSLVNSYDAIDDAIGAQGASL